MYTVDYVPIVAAGVCRFQWPLVFADSRVVEEEGRSSLEDNSDIIHRSTEKVRVLVLSRVQLLLTPWTVAHQTPLSGEFSGKNTGVGNHFLLQTESLRGA